MDRIAAGKQRAVAASGMTLLPIPLVFIPVQMILNRHDPHALLSGVILSAALIAIICGAAFAWGFITANPQGQPATDIRAGNDVQSPFVSHSPEGNTAPRVQRAIWLGGFVGGDGNRRCNLAIASICCA